MAFVILFCILDKGWTVLFKEEGERKKEIVVYHSTMYRI